MEDPCVKVATTEGGIALVTLNRPQALNALNDELLEALDRTFADLAHDHTVRAVILTGEGKAFVAGADIRAMANMTPPQAREFALKGQAVLTRIADFDAVVIAAVNGFALGGGCELAMACDIRIASERAKFGQPEVGLGIMPGFGGTQRLPRLVGRGHARQMLFTGEVIAADRALQIGLVQEVVAPEALLERCTQIARLIASRGPMAVLLCKQAVNIGIEVDLEKGLQTEAALFGETFATSEQKEGMTAFLEKRPARFTDR